MTANELADAVEGAGDNSFNDQASRMLRQQAYEIKLLQNDIVKQKVFVCQQQAEIEALERRIDTQRQTIARYQSILGDVDSEVHKWKLKHD